MSRFSIHRFVSALSHLPRAAWHVGRFFLNAYRYHWFATPAAAVAAVVSTFGVAAVMLLISPILHSHFDTNTAIVINAIVAPMLAYLVYLSVYYGGMFLKERVLLVDESGQIDRAKLADWFRVVKYDYLAHVPSDIYLISLAAIMQATLEKHGTSIFWAVITSQFVDDLITFLKEPAIWNGAKEVVAWENREDTTLRSAVIARLTGRS